MLFFLSSSGYCQVGTNDSINAATPLQEIFIGGFHINDSLMNAPASVAILSAADLQQNNLVDISQIINIIPGVYMQTGAYNTNRISIRGIGARTPYGTNKIRAFYGSIPLTSGDSETTIEDLNIEALSQAEIIKGPLSSLYGAGLGGAILLTPYNKKTQGNEISIGSTHGSFGLLKTNVQYSGNFNSSTFNINYHNIFSDGYRQNSSYRREGVTLNGELFRRETGKLTYLFSHTYLKAFIPSSVDLETFTNNPRAAAFTWLQAKGFEQYDAFVGGLAYDFRIGKIDNSTSVFMNIRDSNEPRPFDILKQQTDGFGARTQFSAGTKIGGVNARFILGAEIFSDGYNGQTYENLYQENDANGSLQGNRLSNTSQDRNFFNVFAQARFVFSSNWEIQAGINANKTSFTLENFGAISGSESYDYDLIWSPQISVLYKPSEVRTIYFSASRGFSLPAIEETLTENGSINSGIKPETGYNFELGAKLYFFNRNLYAEASLFRMEINDLLVARRVGDDQYVGINAGKTLHHGLEASLNYTTQLWKVIGFSLSGGLSLGQYEFVEFIDGDNDFSGNELTGVPKTTFNGRATFSYKRLYLAAEVSTVHGFPINDANSVYTDSYSLLNLKTGYSVTILKNLTASMDLGLNNAANQKYASMVLVNATAFGNASPRFYYPGLPANFYGNVSLRYAF